METLQEQIQIIPFKKFWKNKGNWWEIQHIKPGWELLGQEANWPFLMFTEYERGQKVNAELSVWKGHVVNTWKNWPTLKIEFSSRYLTPFPEEPHLNRAAWILQLSLVKPLSNLFKML